MIFQDREEAGRGLAERLGAYRGMNPLILAIPRGGVVVGSVVARELDGELDVALVAKLRAPANPELAIGAVTEAGEAFWEARPRFLGGISEEHRQREMLQAIAKLRERRARYTPSPSPHRSVGARGHCRG